ncbi:hypothetical protein TeGR_g2771 [Tetraparma gracilis]|uniref:LNS2/PITP domain-containing protein n=1 Tax=Tetraparma gracilis TaxID=2962635 RepID=A0ABQ6MYL6_9STRA|nr:hypothetical protein TeGR_g2771 [Tetraparma gracilis]
MNGVSQDDGFGGKAGLPNGCVLCHTGSIREVLVTELVKKNPNEFKADVLRRQVVLPFAAAGKSPNEKLFVAGFGNKATDSMAYSDIGIAMDDIYIINKSSTMMCERDRATLEVEAFHAVAGDSGMRNNFRRNSILKRLPSDVAQGLLAGELEAPGSPRNNAGGGDDETSGRRSIEEHDLHMTQRRRSFSAGLVAETGEYGPGGMSDAEAASAATAAAAAQEEEEEEKGRSSTGSRGSWLQRKMSFTGGAPPLMTSRSSLESEGGGGRRGSFLTSNNEEMKAVRGKMKEAGMNSYSDGRLQAKIKMVCDKERALRAKIDLANAGKRRGSREGDSLAKPSSLSISPKIVGRTLGYHDDVADAKEKPPARVWAKLLDDQHGGQVLSDDNIMDAFFACGLDPTFEQLTKIFEQREVKSRAESSLKLVNELGYSLDAAEELIMHWRRASIQFRPDDFEHVPWRTVFWARLASYIIPFAAFFEVFKSASIPNYSPVEQSLYHIMKYSLSAVAGIVSSMLWVALAVTGLGLVETISMAEISAIYMIMAGTVFATQASREAGHVSTQGVALRQEAMRIMIHLRGTRMRLTDGTVVSGFQSLVKATDFCGTKVARLFLLETTQTSPLAHFNLMNTGSRQGRRSSSFMEFEALLPDSAAAGDQHGKQITDKYQVLSCGPGRMLPWITALGMASVPTVVGKMRGELTMLDAEAPVADVAVDILLFLSIILCACFSVLVVLQNAFDEMSVSSGWATFLTNSISKGLTGHHQVGDNGSFYMRLDNARAVREFDTLRSYISSACNRISWWHKGPFEVLSVLCIVCAGSVFVGSLLEVEVDVWNVLLLLMGFVSLPVMVRVFLLIIGVDSKLFRGLKKGLRHQKRMNETMIIHDRARGGRGLLSDETIRDMREANEAIDVMCAEIDDTHRTPKLFGLLPLTRDNLVKMSGAIAAGLFTTILRQAMPNM